MPTLKWKLKDNKNCEGCPNLITTTGAWWKKEYSCKLDYYKDCYNNLSQWTKRPQTCIDELGN